VRRARRAIGLGSLGACVIACGAGAMAWTGEARAPSAATRAGDAKGGADQAKAAPAAPIEIGDREGWRGGCPPDMASIDGRYCVDRFEASLREILPNGEERPWSPFLPVGRARIVRAVSERGAMPQAYVSEQQAGDACRRAGKRLCTAAEWTAACMGPSRTRYPYGDVNEPGRCNDDGRSPVVATWGFKKSTFTWDKMNAPFLNQMDDTLSRAGDRQGCTNGYGVYDMVGNLHEWVEDAKGTFYGGYYQDTHQHGDGCAYKTTAHSVTYHDYSTGFRCCAGASAP